MKRNWKKMVPMMALGVALLGNGAVSEAAVPQSELVLGGIEYNASRTYLESVYGTPTEDELKHSNLFAGEVRELEYGDSFELLLVDGAVQNIEISRHNGIKTPKGIEVGSTLADVKAAYGEPDRVRHNDYIYYVDGNMDLGFVFEIENNKVTEIEAGLIS